MLKTTSWTPDTCGCTILYQWDDSVPEDQRVHTPVAKALDSNNNVISTTGCQMHASYPDCTTLHDAVLAENQMKNTIANAILVQNPELFIQSIIYVFSVSMSLGAQGSRMITISVPSKPQATADPVIVALVNKDFNGLVVLQ